MFFAVTYVFHKIGDNIKKYMKSDKKNYKSENSLMNLYQIS